MFRSGLEEMPADGTSLALSTIIPPNISCLLVRPSFLPPFNEPHVYISFILFLPQIVFLHFLSKD